MLLILYQLFIENVEIYSDFEFHCFRISFQTATPILVNDVNNGRVKFQFSPHHHISLHSAFKIVLLCQ